MKHIRRTLALLLAAALVLALSIAAFADGTADTGSITINNAVDDKVYKIYRIFDLDSHSADYKAFNYKVSAKWKNFFATGAAGLTYVKIDDLGYVTWIDGQDAAAFSAAALKYATDNSIVSDGQQTASGSNVKFENLPLGYYLVESGLGALCSLDTTLPDVTIKEKNSAPTVEKKVDNAAYNDANIGDTVTFTTTINVTDGNPVAYVLHDKMSEGLTFDKDSVTVKVNNSEFAASNYTLVTENLADGCTFEIQFHDVTTGEVTASVLKPNDVVTVTYTAKVNDKAVIAGEGNPNETWLKYNNTAESNRSTTRTYVWDMTVVKFTKKNDPEKGETEIKLAGAEFVLYRGDGNNKEYVTAENGKVTGWVKAEDASKVPSGATVFTTPDDGTFTIIGLDSGTYYLKEIKAPAGYNMLKDAVTVVIEATADSEAGTMTATVKYGSSVGDVKVENQTGTELPSTGGVGTTIFYIIGSLLAAGAVILLVTRKRMGKTEE